MESWAYASEGRGFMFPGEIDNPFDAHAKDRRPLSGCNRKSVESVMELGFSQMPRSPFYDVNTSMIHSSEVVIDSGDNLESYASTRPSNSLLVSLSNHSNSIMEANTRDSAQINLKLGGLAVRGDVGNNKFSTDEFILSSGSSTVHAKRARTASTRFQASFCQVYGCNKDLSSSKDYNKRHKVCEVHSKSPKVIVNGIDQRFCQQCSRFHLLSEFDDGKRSCRKRLADHNERRRKPQFITLSGRTHKLLQSCKGGIHIPERYEQANWHKHVKLEGESIYNPPIVTPVTNKQLLPTSMFHQYGNSIPNAARISPLRNLDFSACDTASTIYNSTGMSLSSCALSLLSAESQDLSHLARDNHSISDYHIVGSSDKLLMNSIENITPSGSHWSKVNSTRLNQTSSYTVSSAFHSVDLQVRAGGVFEDSDLFNTKLCLSSEEESTVDLLQLSSHLQRVEQQRSFMQVKNEDDNICSFPSAY